MSTKRPFYQSTQTITIGCIDRKAYYDFSATWFARQNLLISEDTFSSIYDEFEGHTWYIQAILNRLYGYSVNPDQEMVSRAIRLIKAIAKERIVPEINVGSFISKYKLKAASNVNSALRTLTKMEMVYRTEAGYIVYDRFFAIWLRQQPY